MSVVARWVCCFWVSCLWWGIPQGIELLDAANIYHAVVKELVQGGHVLDNEAAILPDRVARENKSTVSAVLLEVGNGACFGFVQGGGGSESSLPQA